MGEYVDIGPVHMWYETHGEEGEPLLLLHGDLETNDSWAPQLDALAAHFRVFALERRGHGHTPDVDAPLTYEVLADDTIGFIDKVVGGPAHLVGLSGGANVCLLTALRRPEVAKKLVLISANTDPSGNVPELRQATLLPADSELFQPFRDAYNQSSRDGPEHWPVFFSKVMHLWQTEPHIALADLAGLRARTLVMGSDDDAIILEHTLALYRAIPDAELAIIPGTSHLAPMEKPGLVNELIVDFLQHDAAPTLLPIRRAERPAPSHA